MTAISTVVLILGVWLRLMISFGIISCLPAVFGIWRGRNAQPLRRLPFTIRTLALVAACFAWLAIFDLNAVADNILFLGIATVIIWMLARIYQMRLIVRRLRDCGYSYRLAYWCLIPFVDLAAFLWLALIPSRLPREPTAAEVF